MQIPVEFELAFASQSPIAIQVGRLYLGPFAARLMFCPDGNTRLVVDKEAIGQGFVVGIDVDGLPSERKMVWKESNDEHVT